MNEQKNPLIVEIYGSSGVGKSSVVEPLLYDSDHYQKLVTCTTRSPRPGEVDGVDYNFLSDEEFDRSIENGDFFEWINYQGHRYGSRKQDYERLFSQNKPIIAQLDLRGITDIKKTFDNITTVFIDAPSREEVVRRLNHRGTETEASLEERMKVYDLAQEHKGDFDYVIVNDDLPTAQQELQRIIHKRSRDLN